MVRDMASEKNKRHRGDGLDKAQPAQRQRAVRKPIDLKTDNNGKRSAGERKKTQRTNKKTDIGYLHGVHELTGSVRQNLFTTPLSFLIGKFVCDCDPRIWPGREHRPPSESCRRRWSRWDSD